MFGTPPCQNFMRVFREVCQMCQDANMMTGIAGAALERQLYRGKEGTIMALLHCCLCLHQ